GGGGQPQSGGWGAFAPAIVQQVCNAALVSIVVVLVSARRGVTSRWLGTRLPRPRVPDGAPPAPDRAAPGRAVRMAALGLLAFSAGGTVTVLVTTRQLPHQLHPSVPYLVYSVFGSGVTAVVEEMVALAFVVSTLKQAKRPVAEILIVAVLLRCSYHIYYGPGILGVAVWAAVFVLLYLRFGSVIPLIVLHFFWDAGQFLTLKWHWFALVDVAAALVFLIAALVVWLVDLLNRHPSSPYAQAPPYGTAPASPYLQPPRPPADAGELNGAMADIAEFQELTRQDHGLVTVSVLRDEGSISSTVVNAGVLPHPALGRPVVGMVIRGGTRKLDWLRKRPYTNVVVRAGWQWAAAEGPVELIGPDDPYEGFDAERLRVFLRDVFTAAGGTHDDFEAYDRVMAAERRTAVLLTPEKIYSNPGR
ncbi:MAG: CPBP family intramembrane metalloprotease, partial [Streptosporangiales bacterium]|nr:CPBP family intramembrane metalloprotease [Streptosporangiales bacterium]